MLRLIRLKINPKVSEALKEVNRLFRIGDRGFVEDVFALLRLNGSGLPSKQRIEKLITFLSTEGKMSPVSARIIVGKRAAILKQITSMAYFRGLTALPDPVDGTRRVFLNFKKFYLKTREAQCRSCHLFNQCQFGQQYADKTTDIRGVIDPDFDKKVDENCPVRPQIEAIFQISEAIKQIKQISKTQAPEAEIADVEIDPEAEEAAEEQVIESELDDDTDEGSLNWAESGDQFQIVNPASRGLNQRGGIGNYKGSHTGERYVKWFEKMIDDLSAEKLIVFELGQRFDMTLIASKQGQFSPTDEMSADRDNKRIASESDLPKLVASEHAMPDEVFENKLQNRSLQKKQDMTKQKKKQLLYLLIDQSGSMSGLLKANQYGLLNRAGLSCVFAASLCRRVRDDGGMVFCRFFSDGVSQRLSAKTKDEFEPLMMMITRANYNAGGTNILGAVKTAIDDITNASDEVSKAEIILISDCEDSFNPNPVKQILGKQEMNVLDVSGNAQLQYAASKSLQSIAKKYCKVNLGAVDISKIVEIV